VWEKYKDVIENHRSKVMGSDWMANFEFIASCLKTFLIAEKIGVPSRVLEDARVTTKEEKKKLDVFWKHWRG
jgi:hypothetical protein